MFDAIETANKDHLEIDAMKIDLCTDAFCDLTNGLQAPVPIYSDAPHLGAKGMLWQAGPAFFSDVEMGSYTFSRAQQQVQDFGHLVAIERYRRGLGHGISEATPYDMHPGELYIFDMQTRCHSVHLNQHVEDMYLPKALLGFTADELVPDLDLPQETLIGKILFTEWDSVFAALRCDDHYLSYAALDRLIACLKIALGAPAQREDVRAQAREALYRQICLHIDAQIEQGDVSAGHLLRQFGISRAGLYRMFEPHGGVRNYITTRRAVRAILDISQNVSQRGIVTMAAERWGFSSAPNFNRTVKRVFSATPGALFKAPVPRKVEVKREVSLIESYMASIAA